MITIKINDSGMKELENVALKTLQSLANNIRDTAKELAPVDTGKLRDNIEVREGNNKWEKLIGNDATVPYAIYQELGTIKMEPNSYLVPALDRVIFELEG